MTAYYSLYEYGVHQYAHVYAMLQLTGLHLNANSVFPGIIISMLGILRESDRFIFIMGVLIILY